MFIGTKRVELHQLFLLYSHYTVYRVSGVTNSHYIVYYSCFSCHHKILYSLKNCFLVNLAKQTYIICYTIYYLAYSTVPYQVCTNFNEPHERICKIILKNCKSPINHEQAYKGQSVRLLRICTPLGDTRQKKTDKHKLAQEVSLKNRLGPCIKFTFMPLVDPKDLW